MNSAISYILMISLGHVLQNTHENKRMLPIDWGCDTSMKKQMIHDLQKLFMIMSL